MYFSLIEIECRKEKKTNKQTNQPTKAHRDKQNDEEKTPNSKSHTLYSKSKQFEWHSDFSYFW